EIDAGHLAAVAREGGEVDGDVDVVGHPGNAPVHHGGVDAVGVVALRAAIVGNFIVRRPGAGHGAIGRAGDVALSRFIDEEEGIGTVAHVDASVIGVI